MLTKCANFAWFADYVGELRGICMIRWNLTGEDNFENFACIFFFLKANNMYG